MSEVEHEFDCERFNASGSERPPNIGCRMTVAGDGEHDGDWIIVENTPVSESTVRVGVRRPRPHRYLRGREE